jgi:hypothetical protein
MEHIYFLLFNFIIFLVVVWFDRRIIRDYALLCFFGLVAALIFENITTYLGFWYYHSEPKIILISLYTWLLYMPYLGFCYFLGRRLGDKNV